MPPLQDEREHGVHVGITKSFHCTCVEAGYSVTNARWRLDANSGVRFIYSAKHKHKCEEYLGKT